MTATFNAKSASKRLNDYLESSQEVSGAGLYTLSQHKYKGGAYTPLDLLFYKLWWTPVSGLVPVWMAPNLVTFIGFIVCMSNIPLMAYYNPYFDKPLPAWVSGYSAFTVFFYLTMDAIDGMQARKTNSSSPLGQLFDHGCDCAITTVFSIMMVNGLGIGAGWMVIAFIASVQVTFFLSQWEEKYTGVCRTNVGGLLGVTETQILLCIQMLTSAWNPHIGDTIVYDHYSYRDCYSMVYLTFMILISISCIAVNLFRHPESARELVSVVGLNFAVFAWSALMGIEKNEYWLVAVALAFCNSFSTIRVIVSSMTHTEFPIWHPFALPFFGIVLGRFIVGGGEWVRLALALYLGGLFDHIVKALIKIVNEISAYLGIYVFNITQKRG